MILLVRKTNMPALKSMAVVEKFFLGFFSVSKLEFSRLVQKFIFGAKMFVDFGSFPGDLEVFVFFSDGIEVSVFDHMY